MFRRCKILLVCGLLLGGGWASTASAAAYHFGRAHLHDHPYYGPYPYFYDYGGLAMLASAHEIGSLRIAYSMDRQLQLQSSLAQTADWRAINQSLQYGNLFQRYAAVDGGQAARDWMYEMQQRAGSRETVPPPGSSREIMRWPTLLMGDRFAVLRSRVETPFRRAQDDGISLTADDYRGVIDALEAMKTALREMKSRVLDTEYAVVEGYLEHLLRDGRNRLEARSGH